MDYLWDIFTDLFNPSGYGNGPVKISYQEIDAFSKVSGTPLHLWEAKVVRDLSEAYIKWWVAKQNTPKNFKPVEMTDTEGLKALFSNVGTKKPKKEKKMAPPPG